MPLVEVCKMPLCENFAYKKQRCREHWKERNTDIHPRKVFYKSGRWKYARKNKLRHDGYICANPEQNPNCTQLATQVDHIVPMDQYDGDPLDEDNLQSLCNSCHSKKTYAEVKGRGDWRPGGD